MSSKLKTSTHYPKISGKLPDLHQNIQKYAKTDPTILQSHPLEFTGTIKLHGTHADIVAYPHGDLECQSRNRARLTPEQDNLGFAAFVRSKENVVKLWIERVKDIWRQSHRSGGVDPDNETVILAGEWIGPGVQKGVALDRLKARCFVLCGVCVGGQWDHIERYESLSAEEYKETKVFEEAGLFCITKSGAVSLDFDPCDEGATFYAQTQSLTKGACKQCPFGTKLGLIGSGEGYVWTPALSSPLPNIPNFWLKTKGEDFLATVMAPKAKPATIKNKSEQAKAFAASHTIFGRLEQALAYLDEMGVEGTMENLNLCVSWVIKDIQIEEGGEISACEIDQKWRDEVAKIARSWLIERLKGVEKGK